MKHFHKLPTYKWETEDAPTIEFYERILPRMMEAYSKLFYKCVEKPLKNMDDNGKVQLNGYMLVYSRLNCFNGDEDKLKAAYTEANELRAPVNKRSLKWMTTQDADHMSCVHETMLAMLDAVKTQEKMKGRHIHTFWHSHYDKLMNVKKTLRADTLSENEGIIEREGGEEAGKLLAQTILKELLKTP